MSEADRDESAPTNSGAHLTRRELRARAAAVTLAAAAIAPDDNAVAPIEPTVETDQPTLSHAGRRGDARRAQKARPAGTTATPTVPPAHTFDVIADPDGDAFAEASRVFAEAGHTQVTSIIEESSAADTTVSDLPAYLHVAPRKRRNVRRIATAGASIGVMGAAAALVVAMALPPSIGESSAVASVASSGPTTAKSDIQAFVASGDALTDDLARSENYSTISGAELAQESGIRNYSSSVFVNNVSAPIQWPFAVGVPVGDGFGMRDGRMHEGADFQPGDGSPVQAIADGTVRIATENGGAYGVNVYIDHEIDGEIVTSHYAHMQYGSLRVKAGDQVTVGTVLGLTGNTGRSFGAHMHFEIIIDGKTIDPIAWLRSHTE
ncbi:M23 family metallopeptidase [Microbacterium sp. ZW T5_56]|uniref:M23 family metallopeptidase n=1 Tax=Microbacterium sp. ZW T5_56 TaxID=3378081 RepID=UPI003854D2E3